MALNLTQAEQLSAQQQKDIQSNLPQVGQVFLTDIGEGAKRLAVRTNDGVRSLGFEYPTDFGGQTIGQLQNKKNVEYAKQLGLDLGQLQTVNTADLIQQFGQPQTLKDVNQFKGFLTGGQFGGATTEVATPESMGLQGGSVQATPEELAAATTATPESVAEGQVQAAGLTQEQPVDIPFRQGLTPDQQASIQNLVTNKPDTSTWTPTDVANWNYATNNSSLPVQGNVLQPATSSLSSKQLSELDIASQRIASGQGTPTDIANVDYAKSKFGYDYTGEQDQLIDEPTPEEKAIQENLDKSGINVPNSTADPVQYVNDILKQSYINQGLPSVKSQIDDISKEVQSLEDKRDAEIRDINENPWLTEGVRLRRIQSIENKYEDKLGNLTDRFTLMQGIYESGIQEAQFVASQGLKFNMWQQEMDQTLLFKQMDLAFKQADAIGDNLDWGVVGQVVDPTTFQVVNQYGWIDKNTGEIFAGGLGTTSINQQDIFNGGDGIPGGATGLTVTDASGATYDIGTYATDPNHEARIQSILDNMGQMTSVSQMDSYIQSVAPGSPITGQMIANASEKYGTSWETMMAIMQQDSSFGTKGAGARSFNPGNVGNTETATSTGNLVNFGDWQSGVDAVAQNLARRRTDGQQVNTQETTPTQYPEVVKNAALSVQADVQTLDQAKSSLPKGYQNLLAQYLLENPSKKVSDIQQQALDKAERLKEMFDGGNRAAIGKSSVFSGGSLFDIAFPGSETADFINTLNQLTNLLSLSNVGLLKGQGQVSDGERRILESASSGGLKRTFSEKEWYKNLLDTISALQGNEIKSEIYGTENVNNNDPLGILNQ